MIKKNLARILGMYMPQPISRILSNASVLIGNVGDRPLARHPALALLAIESLSSWSNVENFLLKLFVQLFGGNESLATDIYLSLEGQSAKTTAINAAVKSIFKEDSDEVRVFYAIMAIAKTNEKDRNKLAHWTWGDSPNLPDALLLVDPRTTITHLDLSKVYVYRESDFLSIIESNNKLCGYGQLLQFVLGGHVANHNGEIISKLLNNPEIQSRLPKPKC